MYIVQSYDNASFSTLFLLPVTFIAKETYLITPATFEVRIDSKCNYVISIARDRYMITHGNILLKAKHKYLLLYR